jgi:hypothetical protein
MDLTKVISSARASLAVHPEDTAAWEDKKTRVKAAIASLKHKLAYAGLPSEGEVLTDAEMQRLSEGKSVEPHGASGGF